MVRVRYSFGSRHTGRIANIKKQRGKYPDVVQDVIRISDIVLEILDVRFIEETRNSEVEENILKSGKKLVYVLNKIDLIDIKKIKKNLLEEIKPFVLVSATKGIGLKELRTRIKIESKRILTKNKGKRKRVHVGVIGYPNTGKSSVINMITRRGVAKTAKQAGFTKGMQKIRFGEGIIILDTPGVIPVSNYSTETSSFAQDAKVGARTYSDVKDPEGAVAFLMKKRTKGHNEDYSKAIEKFYGIEVNGDVEKLIEGLGRKKGLLKKGREVDVDRTARVILRDWQAGKIKI